MKRISQRQLPVYVNQIGLAPLLDLVLVLLLVLLVTLPLLRRERLSGSDLLKQTPTATTEIEAPKVQVKLRIAPDQSIWLDQEKVVGALLLDRLKEVVAKHEGVGVLIEMPDNFAAGSLARLMQEMHRAGVQRTAVEVVKTSKKR